MSDGRDLAHTGAVSTTTRPKTSPTHAVRARADQLVGPRARRWIRNHTTDLERASVVVGGAVLVGSTALTLAGPHDSPALAVALLLVFGAVLSRSGRPWLLAGAAGLMSYFADFNTPPSVIVGALVFLGVILDRQNLWWLTPLAAAGGAFLAVNRSITTTTTMVAIFIALATGLLVRSTAQEQARLISRSADSETHAMWLEQRTALARELHDVVGHHVTAMVVQAEAGLVQQPEHALRRVAELGRSALSELDDLVVHLRDPDAAKDMAAPPQLADIEPVLARPLAEHGITVRVDVDTDLPLDEFATLAAYRIVQEGLTNVLRHAEAARAWVSVRSTGSHVRISVTDDGCGPAAGIGSGHDGIGERVGALGGVWSFTERPDGGSQLEAYLPLSESETP